MMSRHLVLMWFCSHCTLIGAPCDPTAQLVLIHEPTIDTDTGLCTKHIMLYQMIVSYG